MRVRFQFKVWLKVGKGVAEDVDRDRVWGRIRLGILLGLRCS